MNTSLDGDSEKYEIVMQSTTYNCGPAALATVLKYRGINCSENELAQLAGTDETGTTMYGLMKAAQQKGLEARGMRLPMDNLKVHDIVFIRMGNSAHYSVIRHIHEDKVFLADPSMGEIEINKKEFQKIYTGNALVII